MFSVVCALVVSFFPLLLTPNEHCLEFALSAVGGYFCDSTLASACASVNASTVGVDVSCWNALFDFYSNGKCTPVSLQAYQHDGWDVYCERGRKPKESIIKYEAARSEGDYRSQRRVLLARVMRDRGEGRGVRG